MMLRELMQRLAAEEAARLQRPFFAPWTGAGKVCVRLGKLVYQFGVRGKEGAYGWGIFQPTGPKTASWVEEASLRQVEAYLALFPAAQLRLVARGAGRTWLAVPEKKGDYEQRFGPMSPVLVHLVEAGTPFEVIRAHFDGRNWWYHSQDYATDPRQAEVLRAGLAEMSFPEELRFSACSPEMRMAYELAFLPLLGKQMQAAADPKDATSSLGWFQGRGVIGDAEKRLTGALLQGGGELLGYTPHGDNWVVQWRSSEGDNMESVVLKKDLTVLCAGICLSGEDEGFDLASLVRVVEERPDWMR